LPCAFHEKGVLSATLVAILGFSALVSFFAGIRDFVSALQALLLCGIRDFFLVLRALPLCGIREFVSVCMRRPCAGRHLLFFAAAKKSRQKKAAFVPPVPARIALRYTVLELSRSDVRTP
jgi:hypothetical protein